MLGAGRDDPVLTTVAIELPNLRAALDQAAATDPNAGLRLVAALTLFWLFTGRYQEGDAAYASALAAAGEEPTPLRGRVLAARTSASTAARARQHPGGRRRRWR